MTDSAPSSFRPQHLRPRSLAQLVDNFGFDHVSDTSTIKLSTIKLSGVSLNSRDVVPGDLYVGMPGRHTHGASYALDAAQSGAVAILTDPDGVPHARCAGLPVIVVHNVRPVLGAVSAWIYGTDTEVPQLFAVTGTNGKTSVVYILNAILTQLGVVAGLSSTAERRIGDIAVTSSLTTPEATELHALIARMREADVQAVAVEVSAQALSRHRVDGLIFDVVGFTNLSHDHLDDYKDFDDYFTAKLQLFQPDRARQAVITVDTEWGRTLVNRSGIPLTILATTDLIDTADDHIAGTDAARRDASASDGEGSETVAHVDWQMTLLDESATHTVFRLDGPGESSLITQVPLLGRYMAANAALAIVMLVEAGFALESMAEVFGRDGGIDVYIPGRAERISGDSGPLVFIDYGHSPDAFLSTLSALRKVVAGRILMVFGADGDRDTTKRSDMGAIAARGADVVVVTDFNPRWEDPATIRQTLITAAREAAPQRDIYEVADPRAAFRFALSLARNNDAILYAGPGHEDYQEVAGKKLPYSARNDARTALREAGWLPRETQGFS
jgi:UDP-N-acetylmuramoyl-L-alanyl-D-glutamate--2,6-diaminopimelate ligase